MRMRFVYRCASTLLLTVSAAGLVMAQGTLEDYRRGERLQAKARGLVVNLPGSPNWIGETSHFWYYRSVKGGTEFMLVDAAAGTKKPAFDHDRLATAISAASRGKYTGLTLPFAPAPAGRGGAAAGRGAPGPAPGALTFLDNETAIQFGASGFLWKCELSGYTCTKGEALPPAATGGRGSAPFDEDDAFAPPPREGGDPADGLEWEPPSPQHGGGRGAAATAAAQPDAQPQVCTSFDGKCEAIIQNYNVFLRPAGTNDLATP